MLRPLSTQGLLSSEDPKLMLCLCTILFRDLRNPLNRGVMRTVCNQPLFLFSSSLICRRSACDTNVTISMSFGGRSWSIDPRDFNTGVDPGLSGGLCIGAIFDLGQGSNADPSGPAWVVGDSFMVCNLSRLHSCPSYLNLFF